MNCQFKSNNICCKNLVQINKKYCQKHIEYFISLRIKKNT